MLSSIHPLGERGRGNRWGTTAMYYVIGAALGGAAMGGLVGLVGFGIGEVVPWTDGVRTWILVIAALLAAAIDVLHLRMPSPDRQVSEAWMNRYRSWVYGGGYGFQLGTGVMTFVKTASIYLLWFFVLVIGSVAAGVVIGSIFGLVRGLALLTVRRVYDPQALRDYFKRLASLAKPAHVLVVATSVLAASVLVVGDLT